MCACLVAEELARFCFGIGFACFHVHYLLCEKKLLEGDKRISRHISRLNTDRLKLAWEARQTGGEEAKGCFVVSQRGRLRRVSLGAIFPAEQRDIRRFTV